MKIITSIPLKNKVFCMALIVFAVFQTLILNESFSTNSLIVTLIYIALTFRNDSIHIASYVSALLLLFLASLMYITDFGFERYNIIRHLSDWVYVILITATLQVILSKK